MSFQDNPYITANSPNSRKVSIEKLIRATEICLQEEKSPIAKRDLQTQLANLRKDLEKTRNTSKPKL